MTRTRTVSLVVLATAAGMAGLFVADNTSSILRSGFVTQADARIGRPGTPMSVAGVARRQTRRAYYGGAALGAGAYYGAGYGGYSDGYYGGGYANRSYITGRPTLFPRYYGGAYAAGGYPGGYYGASAAAAASGAYAAGPGTSDPVASLGGGNYVPDLTSTTVVDQATGRRCTIQADGYHWCWTP